MDSTSLDPGLCDFCIQVNHFITTPQESPFTTFRRTTIVLTAPSPFCFLCDRINEYLRGIGHFDHWLSATDDGETHCKVFVRRSGLGNENGLACEIDLHIGQLSIYLDIWADEGSTLQIRAKCRLIIFANQITGSRAAEFMISRPPIIKDHSERTFQLIQKWLYVCSDTHGCDECPYSGEFIDKDETHLPTRILKIDLKKKQPAMRLINTHGMKGRYCALSYCWGSAENMPLRSTTSNIHEHFEMFEWNKLPKTFQDSVILCSKLGMEYLWIDSLCIIQDDTADWGREASRMGSLYKNAFLVIVASGASDSTEGLFIGDRPNISSFTLPFLEIEDDATTDTKQTDGQRENAGIYHLMFAPLEQDKSPSRGPLANRGWALQEWHLARRKISFMPGGITWSCVSENHDERGYPLDLDMYSDSSWAHFLWEYTDRRLTCHTDRLKAVEGVANEMERGGREGYNNGTWADDCISDVLWISLQRSQEKDDLRNLPSWSWASTGSPKDWLLKNMDKTSYKPASTTSMTDANTLLLSGKFITADTTEPHLHDCCVTALLSSTERGIYNMIRMELPHILFAEDWHRDSDLRFHRLLLEFRATQSLRGLALMDSVPRDRHDISCILLAGIDLDESEAQSNQESQSDEESDEESDKESDSMYSDFPISHHDKVSQSLRRLNREG